MKLDLASIQVVSFASEAPEHSRGTVRAFSDNTPVFACSESHGLSCDSCFPNYCPREPASKDVC